MGSAPGWRRFATGRCLPSIRLPGGRSRSSPPARRRATRRPWPRRSGSSAAARPTSSCSLGRSGSRFPRRTRPGRCSARCEKRSAPASASAWARRRAPSSVPAPSCSSVAAAASPPPSRWRGRPGAAPTRPSTIISASSFYTATRTGPSTRSSPGGSNAGSPRSRSGWRALPIPSSSRSQTSSTWQPRFTRNWRSRAPSSSWPRCCTRPRQSDRSRGARRGSG